VRIAIVVLDLRIGGKENCVIDLTNALSDNGCLPILICLDSVRNLRGKIHTDRVHVIEMKKRAGNDFRLPFRLAKVFKRERIDIVHSNNWGTMLECVLAAKLAGIQSVVHTQHGMDYGLGSSRLQPRSRLQTIAKRLTSRGISRMVAVSQEVKEMIVQEWKVPQQHISVIHNGVHLDDRVLEKNEWLRRRREFGLDERNFVVGTVGVLRPVKNFPSLVEAMAQVVQEVTHARLIFIGDGPCRKDIEAAVEGFHLKNFVRFLGSRSDVIEMLQLMDLFVLPSISEGISLSLLEAMAAGLPVVATRVGGNPQVVQEMETGILVPPHSPSEMAKAILCLIGNSYKRRVMGLRARDRVQTYFSVERMVRDYKKLYGEVKG